MPELNRNDIIKALECCKSPKLTKCNGCPREEEDGLCMYRLNEDALTLIKQLTEENEKLKADVVPRSECEKWYAEYHKVKEDLKQEKIYHRATEKLADKYLVELKQAKTEVAREIFEEIEIFAEQDIKARQKYLDKFYGKKAFHDTRSNWLGGKIDGIKEFMEECIADLKKKYIGEGNEQSKG